MIKNKKYLNLNNGDFFIPSGNGFSRLEVKKSIFITNLTKIDNSFKAKNFINNIKKTYHRAEHHCWAYIIGNPMNPDSIGSDDDGEPFRSATKPIINVLKQNNVGHTIVIITRYFGGVKIGIGGLRRAYSKSTSVALNNVKLKYFCLKKTVKAFVPYNFEGLFSNHLNRRDISVLDIKYHDLVIFKISLDEPTYLDFCDKIKNKTKNKVIFQTI